MEMVLSQCVNITDIEPTNSSQLSCQQYIDISVVLCSITTAKVAEKGPQFFLLSYRFRSFGGRLRSKQEHQEVLFYCQPTHGWWNRSSRPGKCPTKLCCIASADEISQVPNSKIFPHFAQIIIGCLAGGCLQSLDWIRLWNFSVKQTWSHYTLCSGFFCPFPH